MSTSLPGPRRSGPGHHALISKRFFVQAKAELQRGDRLQASGKTWGAAAHAVKAVAEQRGWNHYHHAHLFAAAAHFAKEFDRPDFHRWMSVAQSMHTNFYDNIRGADEIAQAIDDIEQFVRQLEDVRSSPPRPFTIEDSDDRARIRTLTGTRFEIVAYSPAGFSLNGTPTATYEDAEMK